MNEEQRRQLLTPAPSLPQYGLFSEKDEKDFQFIEANLYKENVTVKVGHIATVVHRDTTLLSYRQIEKGTNLSQKSVRCAIKRLIENGEMEATPKGYRYTVFSLPARKSDPG